MVIVLRHPPLRRDHDGIAFYETLLLATKGKSLSALDPVTGAVKWIYTLGGGQFMHVPLMHDDVLYFSINSNLVA